MSDVTRGYLKQNDKQISEHLALGVRMKLNRKLKGVSSTKIISFFKFHMWRNITFFFSGN